jgi:asparagine synthase (glutamine-hydrolysing)
MCGICGVVSLSPDGLEKDPYLIQHMVKTLYHRGPDDEGYYIDKFALLGMRRLSIIDLVTGQQPVTNEDNSIQLIYNGEIYNYLELREHLIKAGHEFRSKSDSEVIVHAYEDYSYRCVDKFNGMFAFALWDTSIRRLFLARDRLGIKPLYYSIQQNQIIFGSELKAVVAHPNVQREIDLVALDQFLSLEYIPYPRTIYKDIFKLPPGHILTIQDGNVNIERYWDVYPRQLEADETTCKEILTEMIGDSVRLRMVSDVPLGSFLSGGIDSSTVLSFMCQHSNQPVKTFSIGFEDQTYNELSDAQKVAKHFGTEHYAQVLRPNITALAEKLLAHMDEPLADFSIFPTYLVSELASRHVKVVLSGDGGDELFGGYDTYVAEWLSRYYQWLPRVLRQQGIPALTNLLPPQPTKKGVINKTKRWVEGAMLPSSLKHTRWMIFMQGEDKAQIYNPDLKMKLDGDTTKELIETYFQQSNSFDEFAQGQYVDIKTYLVDDILTKVDRMSMAASIEARVPLLDHRIVEFAVNLPPGMKLHLGKTKVILRQAMDGQLPKDVLKKPKQGFSIPIKHWLRGPLKSMMLDLLSYNTIQSQSYFQPKTVQRMIDEHLVNEADHSHRLWALMVFQLWHQQYLPTVV